MPKQIAVNTCNECPKCKMYMDYLDTNHYCAAIIAVDGGYKLIDVDPRTGIPTWCPLEDRPVPQLKTFRVVQTMLEEVKAYDTDEVWSIVESLYPASILENTTVEEICV